MTHWLIPYRHGDSKVYGIFNLDRQCVLIEADANPLGFGFCDG